MMRLMLIMFDVPVERIIDEEHKRAVTRICFVPTHGSLLLSASSDSTMKLWVGGRVKPMVFCDKSNAVGREQVDSLLMGEWFGSLTIFNPMLSSRIFVTVKARHAALLKANRKTCATCSLTHFTHTNLPPRSRTGRFKYSPFYFSSLYFGQYLKYRTE